MALCLIGLGSNVGDRRANLAAAVERLSRHGDIALVRFGGLGEYPPVGGPSGQRPYLNAAVVVETALGPGALLDVLRSIENELGRRRTARWDARPIDLDLLLYDQLRIDQPGLEVPHPRLAVRRFVIEPAATIAGEMTHPVIGWTIRRLLEHLDTARPYIALAGRCPAGRAEAARRLAVARNALRIDDPVNHPVGASLPTTRPAGSVDDPASRGSRGALEYLDLRAGLLDVRRPEWGDRRRLVVSDFWIGQCVAELLAGPDRESADRWIAAARAWLAEPKLVVLLDPPEERRAPGPTADVAARNVAPDGSGSPPDDRTGAARETPWPELLQPDALRRVVFQPGRGPALRITGGRSEVIDAELLAAVDAMECRRLES